MKASMPWYSSSAKLSGIGSEPIAFGAFGWLPKNCSTLFGWGASGGLAVIACSRSRKSSPVPTGKNLNELVTMSVSAPPGRWYLMAMPRGIAGEPSGTVGIPLPSEKGAEARMYAVHLVRQIDDLRREGWVVCDGPRGSQQK